MNKIIENKRITVENFIYEIRLKLDEKKLIKIYYMRSYYYARIKC